MVSINIDDSKSNGSSNNSNHTSSKINNATNHGIISNYSTIIIINHDISLFSSSYSDSLQGSSVKLGTIQIILSWPLRKDDTHTSRSVNNSFFLFQKQTKGPLP